MIKDIFLRLSYFAGLLALGACTTAQVQKDVAIANQFCAYDAQFQPIAGAMISMVPNAAPVVSVDNAIVHPAVLAACGTLPQPKVIVTPPGPPVVPVAVPPK